MSHGILNFVSPNKSKRSALEQDSIINQYLTPELKGSTNDEFLFSSLQQSQTEVQKSKGFSVSSFNSPLASKEIYGDRFIPCRTSAISKSLFNLDDDPVIKSGKGMEIEEDKSQNYNNMLKSELFSSNKKSSQMEIENNKPNQESFLKFRTVNQSDTTLLSSFMQDSPFSHKSTSETLPKPPKRIIPKTAYKVLDAPGLLDDYYVDILDWGSQNQICVSLSNTIYLWGADSGNVTKLCEETSNYFTSLKFNPNGVHLLLGYYSGICQLWDIEKQMIVRNFDHFHQERVGSLSWNNNVTFASGSKDKSILVQDIRQANPQSRFKGHSQEVCGLSFSQNEQTLASGGNDNRLNIWSLQKNELEIKLREHKAAVRAVEFSPHQNGVLLSGGGTKDQSICIWNTLSHTLTQKIRVESQVCKIKFSKNSNEFVSTHGFEENEIVAWKFPGVQKTATLEGHDKRVLYLAMSPDGKKIVTGAGDETLKFWKIFPGKKKEEQSSLQFNLQDLR